MKPKLTPEELEKFAEELPRSAIICYADDLSTDQLVALAKREPRTAVKYIPERLPYDVLLFCARYAKEEALMYAAHLLPQDELDAMAGCCPQAARWALRYLSRDVRRWVEARLGYV